MLARYYFELKALHVAAVATSIGMFVLRAALRLADQVVVLGALQGARFQLLLRELAAVPVGPGSELRRGLGHRWGRFYRPRATCAHTGRRVHQRGEAQGRSKRIRASPAPAANHRRKHRRKLAAGLQT